MFRLGCAPAATLFWRVSSRWQTRFMQALLRVMPFLEGHLQTMPPPLLAALVKDLEQTTARTLALRDLLRSSTGMPFDDIVDILQRR